MSFKTYRDMKVYERLAKDEVVTEIRLQGKWLRELEFEPGTPIIVECEGGRLSITIAKEIEAEECD